MLAASTTKRTVTAGVVERLEPATTLRYLGRAVRHAITPGGRRGLRAHLGRESSTCLSTNHLCLYDGQGHSSTRLSSGPCKWGAATTGSDGSMWQSSQRLMAR
jgi:hypothetical protein